MLKLRRLRDRLPDGALDSLNLFAQGISRRAPHLPPALAETPLL